jgi:hypothetical protein
MRYLARQGVIDWMVWDREKRCPATSAGRQLLRLAKDEAIRIQDNLNGKEPSDNTPKVEMTANEIALFIRAESDLTMAWPRGAEVTVHASGARGWTVKSYSPDPVRDAEFIWIVRQIAEKLKLRFDLKLH